MEPLAPVAPQPVQTGEVADSAPSLSRLRERVALGALGAERTARPSPGWTISALWIMVLMYFAALALLALWPTEVDASARPFLASVTAEVPWLTYARIELTANVLLFAPFGFLFTLILRRARFIVLPAAFMVSAGIESWQYFVDGRNSSVLDIVANSAGASIGILCAAIIVLARR